jgi:DNA topoisomerase I
MSTGSTSLVLRYVSDSSPGIRRSGSGRVFRYFNPGGKPLKDPATLRRVKALAVPPAWTQVWICPDPTGHIQATGRDSRQRKQYRYHRGWHMTRDETKYNHLLAFARVLPRIRRRVRQDLRRRGLGRDKVIASIVRLLELSAARVGNQEYAKTNRSYGLTTLRDRHLQVKQSAIHLRFRGKSGKEHHIRLDNPRLARIVKRCQDLPGQNLFQYVENEGEVRTVTSSDVNAYLAEIAGPEFTTKVFRTWTATVQAALALRDLTPVRSQAEARRNIVRAIEQVAQQLGNTPSVCKKCYIHPAILEAYSTGALAAAFQRQPRRTGSHPSSLRPEEVVVVALLQRHVRSSTDETLKKNLVQSLRRWPEISRRRRATAMPALLK